MLEHIVCLFETTASALVRRPSRGVLRIAAFGIAAMTAMLFAPPIARAQTQILLAGQILQKCTLTVAADPNAANVPLAAPGAQHIRVGTATQNCNGRTGFTMYVLSANCLTGTPGAKMIDAVSADALAFSVESNNPTTGGSQAAVTGLLASSCSGQVMRDVTAGIIRNEVSTLYLNYTGSLTLSAGTYQDILTVTMTMK